MGERQTEVCTRGRPVTEAPITTVSNLEVSSSILDDAILTSSVSISAHIRRGTFFFPPAPPPPRLFQGFLRVREGFSPFRFFSGGALGLLRRGVTPAEGFKGAGGAQGVRAALPPLAAFGRLRPDPHPPRRRRIPPPSPSPTPHPPPWPPFSPDTPFGHSLGQGDGRLIAQGEEATDPRRPGGAVGGGVQGEGERRARDRSAACRCTTTGWRA